MNESLSSKIDLRASRLKPYEGFIFLCGGAIDDSSEEPASIRDAISRELAKDGAVRKRLHIAERFKDWSHDGIYHDLVSFENHLAELASVIVLVLESAGSIAELGLFTAIDQYREKLLVFVETTHYSESSFIRLGPVDFLEKKYENFAECHRWFADDRPPMTFSSSAASELQPELASAVLIRAAKPTAERQFCAHSWLDTALLACDLVGLYSALTIREIRTLFEDLECKLKEHEVRQMLFILERVGLLAMEPNSSQRFYVSTDTRQFYAFHLKDSAFDLERFRADRLEEYRESDKKRFRAIQEVRRRHA